MDEKSDSLNRLTHFNGYLMAVNSVTEKWKLLLQTFRKWIENVFS